MISGLVEGGSGDGCKCNMTASQDGCMTLGRENR